MLPQDPMPPSEPKENLPPPSKPHIPLADCAPPEDKPPPPAKAEEQDDARPPPSPASPPPPEPTYCRVLKSRPAWTHVRCPGCVDLPADLLDVEPSEAPQSSAQMQSSRNITGAEATAQDHAVLLHAVGSGGGSRPIVDDELVAVCGMLREAVGMREKYRGEVERETFHDTSEVLDATEEPYDPFEPPPYAGRHFSFEMRRGIVLVWEEERAETAGLRSYGRKETAPPAFPSPPSLATYIKDLSRLIHITSDPAVNSFCYGRLQKLEAKFRLHKMEHEQQEEAEQREVPHRDFYNVRKVDTHIHLAAAMNQKHLLRFIKSKMRRTPDEVVCKSSSGAPMTLAQVFEEMGMTPYDLSIDALGMHTDNNTFCRFDKFNLKYNPLGRSKLREIFLKTENYCNGRYFAEITQELFDDLSFSKYQKAEYRISVYGRNLQEWDQLASWVVDHQLYSPHVRWLIQVPRLYSMFHANRNVRTFSEFLDNLFLPLFEVSADPTTHPKLHLMLRQVVGFDCVDDESKVEVRLPTPEDVAVHPEQWTAGNPHYSYYCYYLYANLHNLNHLRRAQDLSTFCFRPHSGEAGELNHLHAAYLTARGINHGINLRKSPSLQYLYYLSQVGLALSPLSNNALFLTLSKSPFLEFFNVGLNVSLSTDDPLMFHHTREPLMEEYTIAKQVWKLSSVDLAEVARNSVLQSSFEPCVKAFWIGANYRKPGAAGNDIHRTNVPMVRCAYREHTLKQELTLVQEGKYYVAPLPPLPAAPPPPPAPASPPPDRRSKYERYDGPHAMLYTPRRRAADESALPAARGASLSLPQPMAAAAACANSFARAARGSLFTRAAPPVGRGASAGGGGAAADAARLHERLDAMEERARHAAAVNRALGVALAASLVVIAAMSARRG
ncbi:hypothetical protein AB1Y20_014911 [Prymnesium parvum]|uniref:AMP deaminase n=1 Tax=Prymnesium parvum TaxID=97485 RepID=A0AB34JYV2_PRYPA